MLVWIIWFEMKMVQIKKCYQMSQISLNALIQQQERKQVLSLPIYRVLYKHNTVTVSKIYIWAWKVNRQRYHSRWLTVQFASHATFSEFLTGRVCLTSYTLDLRCIVVPNWWRSDWKNAKNLGTKCNFQ